MSKQIMKPVWRVGLSFYGWSPYKTTRTKAAKYERAECNKCKGAGGFAGLFSVNECANCNGKGYKLEAIK